MIRISEKELELLLEKHREQISQNKLDGIGTLCSAIAFFFSTFFASYAEFWILDGVTIKAICFVVSSVFAVYGIIRIVKSSGNKYTHEELLRDIIDLNQDLHAFSLIAIKDSFNEFPNRFLQYFDERWKCWFFLNCRTVAGDADNEVRIRKHVSAKLKVGQGQISAQFVECRTQKKMSFSDNIEKTYQHKLYLVNLPLGEKLKQDKFEIDGCKYRWMTIEEMELDSEIMKKNQDVVAFVKDCLY